MPTFLYNALDPQGQAKQGVMTAESRSSALDQIARMGLIPVQVEVSWPTHGTRMPAGWPTSARRVPKAALESFTRELSNLLAAGVPLGKSLHILQRQATHPTAKEQWAAVHDDVIGGRPLADAMARWPQTFSQVDIAMVRAGEMGGFLDVVLSQIAEFRSRENELKGRVKSAMVYPCVLASLAVAVLIFLMIFFIPIFAGIFADQGSALPLLTRAIVAASDLMTRYFPLAATALLLLVWLARHQLRTPAGQRNWQRFCLSLPGLNTVLARLALVRFARMLGTLLEAGVPLVAALGVSQQAIGNQILADAVDQATEQVKRGQPLSASLGTSSQLFPPSVIEMIAVAEESGRLEKELVRLAHAYEGDLDRRLRMLVSLAEPALLFVMAAIIGTIVVGMLLPIFTLQELIK